MINHNLSPTLQNERVILRPLQESDEALLWPIAQETALWIYGLKDLSIKENLHQYIQSAIKDREIGICAVWVIIDVATGNVAGCTRLAEISWKDERGQIGWTWIGKKYQGSGLNKAMKYEILNYGFETLGLNRIELKADERNVQSRRAILKLGATEEGTLRQHMKIANGFIRNTVFYGILKSEWPEIKLKLAANRKS
ncbi:GNAT family N-acetyltransferase [Pedobacter sandarakinus]|uniref:GNAT family N-acetyltransferase n=1 Tax=Pedobacter sandarakinus TaxID=353156 RepID=UPI0022455B69|nr:GNAT family protein [Pedobacter sandarakinus]MCX2576067.1 GNAT family protein [Pedobacter sandarakinus]